MKRPTPILIALSILWVADARADMIWPSLILEKQILSIPPIAAGLIVEWFVLFFGFGLTWQKASVIDLAMNATSTLAGAVLVPIGGLSAILAGIMFMVLGTDVASVVAWTATVVIAVLTTTAIEALVIRAGFKLHLSRNRLLLLTAANAISVGIAMFGVWSEPYSR
jgi:hypothetical protein